MPLQNSELTRLAKAFPVLYRRPDSIYFKAVPVGWKNLIWNLSQELNDELLKLPKTTQAQSFCTMIRKKMCLLDYALSYSNESLDEKVRYAKIRSKETCVICGKPSSPNSRYAACPEHFNTNIWKAK